MKKSIFAIAMVFVFMFTVISGFSAENTTMPVSVSVSDVATPDEPVNVCAVCGKEIYGISNIIEHSSVCKPLTFMCKKCGEIFYDSGLYSTHIDVCMNKDYTDLTIKEILDQIIDLAKNNMAQWDEVEALIIKIVDLIANLKTSESQEELDAAITELEALGIVGAEDLIKELKRKIKYLYAGELIYIKVDIRTPSQTKINYGDTILLHADVDSLPSYATIQWTADNDNFTIVEISEDGRTCKITPNKSGDTVFTASVINKDNGGVHGRDTQTMTSNAGIFQKILAFFKNLFRFTKDMPEAIIF